MARFKAYSYNEIRHLWSSLEDLIKTDSIAFTIHRVVEETVDRSVLEARYHNDVCGAPAYDPAILLKIVFYGYACGLNSSRPIARACRENILFQALAAGATPHFTTIAGFVVSLGDVIESLFRDVLVECKRQGLLGEETLALDGCKLSSNASKEWSGTKAELAHKEAKLRERIAALVLHHQRQDRAREAPELYEREGKQIETLRAQAAKLNAWLATHEDKIGARGLPIKSNVTDNDSALMKTSHGVTQGYDGLAMVDQKHQVVVYAEAFGVAQEHALLIPMVEGTRNMFHGLGERDDIFDRARLVADSGFYTEANMRYVFEEGIDGYIPDTGFRKRDPRFADAPEHKTKREGPKKPRKLRPEDFLYDPDTLLCTCPAGKPMYLKNRNFTVDGRHAVSFQARLSDCRACPLREQCLRRKDQTSARQVYFFDGPAQDRQESYTDKMKRKIDTWIGRMLYALRLAIVEPIFGNIESNLGLYRFTLRGKIKVNTQWLLYCIVHNLGKLHRYSHGFP